MPDDKSRVDEAQERLYSKTRYSAPTGERRTLGETETSEVKTDWPSQGIDELLSHERKPIEGHPIMKKIFISAIIFFFLAVGVAAYIYLGGGNFISSKNVDISVLGPTSVLAGEPVELNITVSNRNNADLEAVTMTIDYPKDTRSAEDVTQALERSKITIGSISSGKDFVQTQKAVLFGQKGEVQDINISIEYKVKGSNATFDKQKVYETVIGASPLDITIKKPSSITSGTSFNTTITVQANSDNVLKNVVVRGEYPYGYSALSTTPSATSANNNFWILGDLAVGAKKTIVIKGILVGEDQAERTFRFYAGVSDVSASDKFGATLAAASETVSLNRPAIGLSLNINGDESNPYIAPVGSSVTANIKYQNNLPNTLLNTQVKVILSGATLDKFSVKPLNGGFYNSSDNSIVWDKSNYGSLASLEPGDNDSLSFSFASLSSLPMNTKNPEISFKVSVTGVASGNNSSDNVTSMDSRSVRIASQTALSSRSLYSRGVFKNTGPIPPKAEKQTTYTLILGLRNTQNDIDNPVVTATLGPNVKWVGAATSTENISYDSLNNVVTWTLNDLPAGTGFSTPIREAYIQVALTPSIGQIGSTPALLNNISFSGTDTFTDKTITLTNPPLTTLISTDPNFVQGDGIVVK
ncbi:MAG: COG1361 family protein [Minisyncoccota bacterium]